MAEPDRTESDRTEFSLSPEWLKKHNEHLDLVRLAARGLCRKLVGSKRCLCRGGERMEHCISMKLFGDDAVAVVNSMEEGWGNAAAQGEHLEEQGLEPK